MSRGIKTNDLKYICDYCLEQFKRKDKYKRHLKKHLKEAEKTFDDAQADYEEVKTELEELN